MSANNFWSHRDLDQYIGLYRRLEKSRREKTALVRERLEAGYYLTDEIAHAVAARMLGLRPERRAPHAA
ncbi:MAG: hypothetical protein ABIF82_14290 [Planctomycetota bacterium]